ncbi:MAG: hypothetical protein IKL08_05930 [Clostridia bacterium]|nr:hypothetical protein [Clostridia bacterium]
MTKYEELTHTGETQDSMPTTIVYVLGERKRSTLSDYIKFGAGLYIGYVVTKAISKVLKEKLEQK